MNALCAAHNNVADTRYNVDLNIVFYAILQYNISVLGVDTAEKYGVKIFKHIYIAQAVFGIHYCFNGKLSVKSVCINQLFKALAVVIDYSRFFWRKNCIIQFVCGKAPQQCE